MTAYGSTGSGYVFAKQRGRQQYLWHPHLSCHVAYVLRCKRSRAMASCVDLAFVANVVCAKLNLKNQPPQVTSLEVHSAALVSEPDRPSRLVVATELDQVGVAEGIKLQLLPSDARAGVLQASLPYTSELAFSIANRLQRRLFQVAHGQARWRVICKESCVRLMSSSSLPTWGQWRIALGLLLPPISPLGLSQDFSSSSFALARTSLAVVAQQRLPAFPDYPAPIWQDVCGLVLRFPLGSRQSKQLPLLLCCKAAAQRLSPLQRMHSWLGGASFAWSLLIQELLQRPSRRSKQPRQLWAMMCKQSSVQLVSLRAVYPMPRKPRYAAGLVATACAPHGSEPPAFLLSRPCAESSIKLQPSQAFTLACVESVLLYNYLALCSPRCEESTLLAVWQLEQGRRKSLTQQPQSFCTSLGSLEQAARGEPMVCKSAQFCERLTAVPACPSCAVSIEGQHHPAPLWSMIWTHSFAQFVSLPAFYPVGKWRHARVLRAGISRAEPQAFACRPFDTESMAKRQRFAASNLRRRLELVFLYKDAALCSSRCGAEKHSPICRPKQVVIATSLTLQLHSLCTLPLRRWHPCFLALPASCAERAERIVCRSWSIATRVGMFARTWPISEPFWRPNPARSWRLCGVESKVRRSACLEPPGQRDVAPAPILMSFKTLGATLHTSEMRLTAAPQRKAPQSSVASLNHSHSILTSLHMKDFCSRLCLAEHHGQRDYPVLLGRGSSGKLLVSEEGTPSARGLSLENFKEHGMPANRTLCLDVQMSFRGMRLRKLPK